MHTCTVKPLYSNTAGSTTTCCYTVEPLYNNTTGSTTTCCCTVKPLYSSTTGSTTTCCCTVEPLYSNTTGSTTTCCCTANLSTTTPLVPLQHAAVQSNLFIAHHWFHYNMLHNQAVAVASTFCTEASETVPNMCVVVERVALYQVTL